MQLLKQWFIKVFCKNLLTIHALCTINLYCHYARYLLYCNAINWLMQSTSALCFCLHKRIQLANVFLSSSKHSLLSRLRTIVQSYWAQRPACDRSSVLSPLLLTFVVTNTDKLCFLKPWIALRKVKHRQKYHQQSRDTVVRCNCPLRVILSHSPKPSNTSRSSICGSSSSSHPRVRAPNCCTCASTVPNAQPGWPSSCQMTHMMSVCNVMTSTTIHHVNCRASHCKQRKPSPICGKTALRSREIFSNLLRKTEVTSAFHPYLSWTPTYFGFVKVIASQRRVMESKKKIKHGMPSHHKEEIYRQNEAEEDRERWLIVEKLLDCSIYIFVQ